MCINYIMLFYIFNSNINILGRTPAVTLILGSLENDVNTVVKHSMGCPWIHHIYPSFNPPQSWLRAKTLCGLNLVNCMEIFPPKA